MVNDFDAASGSAGAQAKSSLTLEVADRDIVATPSGKKGAREGGEGGGGGARSIVVKIKSIDAFSRQPGESWSRQWQAEPNKHLSIWSLFSSLSSVLFVLVSIFFANIAANFSDGWRVCLADRLLKEPFEAFGKVQSIEHSRVQGTFKSMMIVTFATDDVVHEVLRNKECAKNAAAAWHMETNDVLIEKVVTN